MPPPIITTRRYLPSDDSFKNSDLHKLPPEIRVMIYKEVAAISSKLYEYGVNSDTRQTEWARRPNKKQNVLYNLRATCRVVRAESDGIQVDNSNIVLKITSVDQLLHRDFMARIGLGGAGDSTLAPFPTFFADVKKLRMEISIQGQFRNLMRSYFRKLNDGRSLIEFSVLFMRHGPYSRTEACRNLRKPRHFWKGLLMPNKTTFEQYGIKNEDALYRIMKLEEVDGRRHWLLTTSASAQARAAAYSAVRAALAAL
ncbi:DNA-directed RNA polymerase III subunit rpc1 [Elsinoe australis]|uniref:DNA-directed RNA polymerase III subunit rpc1 n=1 Tax=Elsinoe australis TaxID=40998 RepID=A0A2P7YG19_9PEZI|nr:DNA-directed RNA polymerase III subunit rpc1 [Elsinoe australis]